MVSAGPLARIALAIPVRELFDYRVPAAIDTRVIPGMRVRVPFGRGVRTGYCIERADRSDFADLKEVSAVLDDEPILDASLLRLVRWTADYYLASVGEVIESAVPRKVRDERVRSIPWARAVDAGSGAPGDDGDRGGGAPARRRILEILRASGARPLAALLAEAEASRSPVDTLARRGLVEIFHAPPPEASTPKSAASPCSETAPAFVLSPEQERAVAAIREAIRAPRYAAFLLHGVTGSGKTEVYLHAIDTALAAGRGALVLLPEIALTPQTVARFEARFGEVAVLHSLLPDAERSAAYRRLRRGELRVAVGARSAIFAPIPDLGLIVVDEAHDSSYKQEAVPRYHGSDLATVRGSHLGIPCVLGTATPTLEQLENSRSGRFTLLSLPRRVTTHDLAAIDIVDRRSEAPDAYGRLPLFSRRLIDAIDATLDQNEQAILLLNRRGFARRVHCPSCGFSLRCTECDIGLTYHKRRNHSQCHYCGGARPIPVVCPACGHDRIRRSLPGTERIEETLGRLFPSATVGRLDRDTATSRDRLEEILARFRRGATQILVGTQMVAKGHDIPAVTLVGVMDADVALHLPDFRAAERTCQLLCQVAGRAGRGERRGRVLIQTQHPEHYAIEAARRQDIGHLFDAEQSARRLLCYPPFGYLARVLLEDEAEERVIESARRLREEIGTPVPRGVMLLGPAPAPLARLRGRHRMHVLLKARQRAPIHALAAALSGRKPRWSTTRVTIDIDPQSLL